MNHKPRLVIEKLELENFKSYAGVQQIGPFHTSFSAIVGPNGSGKSNVIDAMLFVFGKRAKQLRLDRVSQLIHKSAEHMNLEAARVSVHFQEIIDQGDGGYEVVPGSQLVITREATKANTSTYYVAKGSHKSKKSNFTEVTTLLKEKGVDLNNNRFLILQGEVEQIAMMKAKAEDKNDTGLLEYLEDIIGTHVYKEPIEAAGEELNKLNEERTSALQKKIRADEDKEALRGDKEKAEELRTMELQLILHRRNEFEREAAALEDNQAALESEVARLQQVLVQGRENLGKYEEELKAVKAEMDECENRVKKVSKSADATRKKLQGEEQDAASAAEQKKHLEQKVTSLKAAMKKLQAKMEAKDAEREKAEAELPADEAKLEAKHADLEAADARKKELEDKCKGEKAEIEERLKNANLVLEPLLAQKEAAEGGRNQAMERLKFLHDRAAALRRRRPELEAAIRDTDSQLADARERLQGLEADGRAARGVVEGGRLGALRAEAAGLEGQLSDARLAVEALRSVTEQQVKMGQALRGLMEAQDRRELKGILGRLGDLGAVDACYDVPVSSASGALNYIVVETMAAAQACLTFLRRHDLGVATFIILEKQAYLEDRARPLPAGSTPPEGAHRVFDLVKVQDKRVRVAFYYAFRETLLVQDMTQGMRISYGRDSRWKRVVTMRGELIQDNGTMTGGGKQPQGGLIRIGSAPPPKLDPTQAAAELERAQATLAELEAAWQAARDAVAAGEEEVRAAEARAAQAAKDMKMAEKQIGHLETKRKDLERQLADLGSSDAENGSADATAVDELEATVNAKNEEVKAMEAAAAEPQAKVDQIKAELEDVGGKELREQRELAANLRQEVKDLEQLVAQHKANIKTCERTAATQKKDRSKKASELEKVQRDLDKCKCGDEGTADRVQRLQEGLDRHNAELEVAKESRNVLVTQHEEKLKEVCAIRSNVDELSNQLEVQKKQLKADAAAIAGARKNCACLLEEAQQVMCGEHFEVEPVDDLRALTDDEWTKRQQRNAKVEAEARAKRNSNINMKAIQLFAEKEAEFDRRVEALAAVVRERDEKVKEFNELREKRRSGFMDGIGTISNKLKEMYQMITLGGDAELEVVDSLDPFAEGVRFSVRPPKKSWKNIANLSGGEKTLSSLALVFALHHYKPTPLYFMDEIDAALDFKNVSIVAHYVKEQTKNAQFVVISLRNMMFELADHLVGIYKTHNCTKSVTIDPHAFVAPQVEEASVLQPRQVSCG